MLATDAQPVRTLDQTITIEIAGPHAGEFPSNRHEFLCRPLGRVF